MFEQLRYIHSKYNKSARSVCITSVLCVQLCNYFNNGFLMQSFFQNISQYDREKTSLYELPRRYMFYIKLFICSFLFEMSFGANIRFQ